MSYRFPQKPKRLASRRCPSLPCTQQRLEDYMSRVMPLLRGRMNQISDIFEYHEVVEIIHGCITMFADEPTLLQFPLPDHGLVVIGDIHGDAFCLLKAFKFYGFPPDTSYLFLGDFVDRGPKQNEILLLILLMKLRWPEYVYMLRGNHELFDVTELNFKSQCANDFNNPYIFIHFNQLFDYLPLGAVISDYFFICHGGVSQWMTCRANIANIQKPTDMNNMKILEGCIVTDMLWSDPDLQQELPFEMNPRGIGFRFNQEALHMVLRALNVHTLIRGHQINHEGVLDNFGDGSCITVHTATREDEGYNASGTIKIIRDSDGEFVIERRVIEIKNRIMTDLCDAVNKMLCESLQRDTLKRITPKCQWCRKAFPGAVVSRVRNAGWVEVVRWVITFAFPYADQDEQFKIAWRERDDVVMNKCAYRLFPVIYDLYSFQGGSPNTPCTFRVVVNELEREFMRKCYANACNFDVTETLANDVDPCLLKIKSRKQKHGKFRRASRRITNVFRHAIGLRDLPSSEEEENINSKSSK